MTVTRSATKNEVYRWLDDERSNLNKEVDGIIVVFGNLGLWNGRRQGYQILGSTIADILKSQCDDAEWYGDGYNIRGRMGHHDGTNYTLYRVAKDRDEAERLVDKIYNREIGEEGFRRRTRSLYPYVAGGKPDTELLKRHKFTRLNTATVVRTSGGIFIHWWNPCFPMPFPLILQFACRSSYSFLLYYFRFLSVLLVSAPFPHILFRKPGYFLCKV